MKKTTLLTLILVLITLTTGCASQPVAAQAAAQNPQEPTESTETITIYAPASTSSIPVVLAAAQMENVQLTLYTNPAQTNTLFLRGDIDMLITGLSVGVDMVRNEAPISLANTYVSGLSYLLTYDNPIDSLADLQGQEIYLPFKGSPLEEITAYLAQQENLTWPDDFKPMYMPFTSSVELLKQGSAKAVLLPEPYVSLLENQPDTYISISLFDEWQKYHPQDNGYPQVGTLVHTQWAQANPEQIERFNQALSDAIIVTQKDPAAAVETAAPSYSLSADILQRSLSRTQYHLLANQAMQEAVTRYYEEIGKPLGGDYENFFYLAAQ